MGCDVLQSRALTALSHHAPHQILRDAFTPYFLSPGDGTKDLSFPNPSRCHPSVKCVFHPLRNRHSANAPSFANQIHNSPMVLAGLDLVSLQADQLGSTETTAQEHGQHGIVSLRAEIVAASMLQHR